MYTIFKINMWNNGKKIQEKNAYETNLSKNIPIKSLIVKYFLAFFDRTHQHILWQTV